MADGLADRIGRNAAAVRSRITAACDRSGREVAGVTLVGVTKTVDAATVRALYAAGIRDFGENRVAPGCEKVAALSDLAGAKWHLIGHLQRNKAAQALEGFRIFHGVESPKLVERLSSLASERNTTLEVFLEVNVSGEESKYGLPPAAAGEMARLVLAQPSLHLRGLMTMAPLTDDAAAIRTVFRGLRQLRDRLRDETGAPLPDLSMGMSHDFEIAIEEGATLVRVGTALVA